jgi:hypothetical protein
MQEMDSTKRTYRFAPEIIRFIDHLPDEISTRVIAKRFYEFL